MNTYLQAQLQSSSLIFNPAPSGLLQRSVFDTEQEKQPQSTPRIGHHFSDIAVAAGIQAKLTVGAPGDQYEQEADRVADRVVSMPNPSTTVAQRSEQIEDNAQMKPEIQRAAPEEEEAQRNPEIQRQAGKIQASEDLESTLHSQKGQGNPLSGQVQSYMEPRFGADFSGVRVHTGPAAVQMNQQLHSQAFAHGGDVFFNSGKYDPDSNSGRHLLAHELTHVVQQGSAAQRKPEIQRAASEEEEAQMKPEIQRAAPRATL
jgi:Domain of unknown function (DUF4157)